MCELCLQEPCAWGCPNAGIAREHRVCTWCDNHIVDAYYYDVFGDCVCAECMDLCRRERYAD